MVRIRIPLQALSTVSMVAGLLGLGAFIALAFFYDAHPESFVSVCMLIVGLWMIGCMTLTDMIDEQRWGIKPFCFSFVAWLCCIIVVGIGNALGQVLSEFMNWKLGLTCACCAIGIGLIGEFIESAFHNATDKFYDMWHSSRISNHNSPKRT